MSGYGGGTREEMKGENRGETEDKEGEKSLDGYLALRMGGFVFFLVFFN